VVGDRNKKSALGILLSESGALTKRESGREGLSLRERIQIILVLRKRTKPKKHAKESCDSPAKEREVISRNKGRGKVIEIYRALKVSEEIRLRGDRDI